MIEINKIFLDDCISRMKRFPDDAFDHCITDPPYNIYEVTELLKDKDVIGEITIVLKGINKKINLNQDKLIIKKDLNDLINAGLSSSAASKYLAKKNGLKKSEIYNMI